MERETEFRRLARSRHHYFLLVEGGLPSKDETPFLRLNDKKKKATKSVGTHKKSKETFYTTGARARLMVGLERFLSGRRFLEKKPKGHRMCALTLTPSSRASAREAQSR